MDEIKPTNEETEKAPLLQKGKAVKKRIRIKSKVETAKVVRDFDFASFGTRRQARLYATQALYQYDMNKGDVSREDLLRFEYEDVPLRPKVLEYAKKIVDGTLDNLEHIDKTIARHSTNWNIERIGYVDRAILRFSIYSLFFQDDVPRSVVIDEAVEIAKIFCDKKSYKFINGILDGIKAEERDS